MQLHWCIWWCFYYCSWSCIRCRCSCCGSVGLTQLNDTAKLGISTSNSNNTSTVSVGGGVTSLNFAGPSVTTAFVTNGIATVFVQGGGGSVGAGTWASDEVGVATSKVVGVGTAQAVGTANSEGALQQWVILQLPMVHF